MTTPPLTHNLSGNQRRKLRSAARFFAIQALFQMERSDQSSDTVIREFADHRFGERFEEFDMVEADLDHFRHVVSEAVNWQARIDQMTDRALVAKWPIARIDPTLRALFRAAGAELFDPETPPKVVISEYAVLADAFSAGGREAKLVTACLDHMAREARPEAF